MVEEKRYPVINGNKYYVKIRETRFKKRVTVYNHDKHDYFYRSGNRKNWIVNNIQRKGRLGYLGKDTTPSIEEMIQKTLNEAVCIRENKEEQQDQFEEEIERAISVVEEAHE